MNKLVCDLLQFCAEVFARISCCLQPVTNTIVVVMCVSAVVNSHAKIGKLGAFRQENSIGRLIDVNSCIPQNVLSFFGCFMSGTAWYKMKRLHHGAAIFPRCINANVNREMLHGCPKLAVKISAVATLAARSIHSGKS